MNHHDEYDLAQLPDYARYPDYRRARGVIPWKVGDELPEDAIRRLRGDPDYLDDIRDPARAARGLFYGMLLSIPFWLAACGIVALAKACTGGG